MSGTRDALHEALGRAGARRAADDATAQFIAALISGDARIYGARVRLEWLDPPPTWVTTGEPGL